MPNNVTNKLTFTGDQKIIDKMLEEIKLDEDGVGSIDFNKIIPMPDSLRMDSGSMESHAIGAYLTALNPASYDLGIPKLKDSKEFNELCAKLNGVKRFSGFAKAMSLEEIEKQKIGDQTVEDFINLGKKYVDNFLQHGSTTWYDWSCREWGSKWNSYSTAPQEGNTITYETAWSSVMPVIERLSSMYPELEINYKWADENIGCNMGEADIKNGKIICEFIPEEHSKEAFEMASEIIGEELAAWGYAYNEKSDTYEFSEEVMEEYERSLQSRLPQMC